MGRSSAAERLDPVHGVTKLGVELEIGCERLVGQQAKFRPPGLGGAPLGMVEQQAAIPPALPFRRDGDVLDPQVIRPQDRLDDPASAPQTVRRSIVCSTTAR